jgi:transcriptional regulator with XRE-family HTH domain
MQTLFDGAQLRALREARGWDKATLAQRAGVSASVLTRLERGSQADLRVSILVALARALEVEPAVLLNNHQTVREPVMIELQAALHEASHLASEYQRHLASIIRAYIRDLPVQ